MALLFVDSFDHYSTAQLAAKGWTVAGGTVTVAGAAARTGVAGLLFVGTTPSVKRGIAVADEHATLIVGHSVVIASLSSATNICAFLSDSGATTHVTIEVTATGAIQARRGTAAGTILGTGSAGAVAAGASVFVESLVTLSDTVGVVTVRVNGVAALSVTAADTKNAGTKTVLDSVLLGRSSTNTGAGDTSIDDFYLCNAAGSAPSNTFLGDVRVRALLPTGNGNSSQLLGSDADSTDNYLLVDEVPADTADYVGSATDDQKDTYQMANLVELTGTVFGVQGVAQVLKTDAGARSAALVTRSGGSDFDSADLAVGTSATFVSAVREADPATAAAWTIAGVNAAEAGVKVRP